MREPGMKERLDFWLNKAQALVDKQGRPGFNDNYLTPATAHPKFAGNPAKLALAIGGGLLSGNVRGALGIDMNGDAANEQQLFCSEMVYHLLTLAHCSQGEIQSGATSGEVPACLQNAPFDQMPFAGANAPGGLGEGPLMVALQEPQALVPQLGSVFCTTGAACDPDSSELSSGHRKANTELLAAQVPQALGLVYQVRGTNPNAPLPAQAAPIATKIPANYSPTAFLIETLREENARTFDYVATVVFADNAQIAKAKTLSANPIPKTDGAN